MRRTLLLFIFCLTAIISHAQDFQFGTFKMEEMEMKSYAKDTSAHAVVLLEHGRSEISRTGDDDINLVYEYHVKIKIFDKTGFEEGNVEIPFYSSDGQTYEKVEDIEGKTTYKDDNGAIKSIDLDNKKIYTVKDNKHWSTLKFAMPGLRDGCVIEYKYRLVSPYFENLHSWRFQSEIPKIYSEYDIHIPGFWTYNASIIGSLKTTKNVAELERACFTYRGANADCSHFVYGMNDIPAFIVEDDMTSPRNFLSAINFELSAYTSMVNGAEIKVAKEWKDVDYELKHAEYFGSQLKKEGLFKDRIAPVIAGKTNDLDKAKAIYEYIKKLIKWNEINAFGSDDGIRKAIDTHSGDAGDINLSLAVALRAAGLNAEVVILSTREHGFINKLYPVITEFNYAVAKVSIGDKSYFLDATDPLLSFGTLPMRCLNDQGRVMSLDKPSYWVDMNNISQKKISNYSFDLTLQPDGKIKGTMTHYSLGYEAYEKRQEIKKFNSVDEYIENFNEKSSRFKIVKSDIANIDSLEQPLTEQYNIEIKKYDNLDHDQLNFNPFIIDLLTRNPYRLAQRNYPVDRGMPSTDRFTLIMHLPDNYTVGTPPEKAGINLPNNGGSFLTDFSTTDNSFTFSHVIQLNKSVYSPEEYPYLKEFYNKIILAERSAMTIKKKN